MDGRSATTHPERAEQLRREFPRVRVEPDRLYVDHGDVATSAGRVRVSTCVCTWFARITGRHTPRASRSTW
nr:hypothetical protein [Actinospica durhamensis]